MSIVMLALRGTTVTEVSLCNEVLVCPGVATTTNNRGNRQTAATIRCSGK